MAKLEIRIILTVIHIIHCLLRTLKKVNSYKQQCMWKMQDVQKKHSPKKGRVEIRAFTRKTVTHIFAIIGIKIINNHDFSSFILFWKIFTYNHTFCRGHTYYTRMHIN